MNHFVTSPAILSNTMFIQAGGQVGTATPAQLNMAFCVAEQWMESEINSPLVTTIFSGTFGVPWDGFLQLPFGHVTAIHALNGIAPNGGYVSSLGFMLNSPLGMVGIVPPYPQGWSCTPCPNTSNQVDVVFSAGFPSGTISAIPNVQLALTTVAQMALLQMTAPYALEGGPGAPGVQQWSDQGYSETRTKLFATMYGRSPQSAFAQSLLEMAGLRAHRALRLY
jgi:hypothetical protein